MSKRVRRRRGTQAQHDEFTGADGELTVNTTDYRVHAHDGSTAGGFATAREDEVSDLSGVSDASAARSNLGLTDTATLTYASQVVELGGDFDAGEEVRCERIGNWVTITGIGNVLQHSSGTDKSSSTGAIPSQFRPSQNFIRMLFDSDKLTQMASDGTFQVIYSGSSRTNTFRPPTITYLVT